MLRRVATPASRIVERWLPGAFVFAVVLTVVVAALALLLTGYLLYALLRPERFWDGCP